VGIEGKTPDFDSESNRTFEENTSTVVLSEGVETSGSPSKDQA
jgi:hypothetical protein